MINSRGCEHEDTKVEIASNRLNGVADPEGATALAATAIQQAAWDRNIKILRHTRESYDMLKTKLIGSILPEVIAALRDPTMAFLHIHPQTILAHITAIHGTLV